MNTLIAIYVRLNLKLAKLTVLELQVRIRLLSCTPSKYRIILLAFKEALQKTRPTPAFFKTIVIGQPIVVLFKTTGIG